MKQLRADLQFEKSNATKFESKLIAVVKEKEALEKAHQAKDAKIEQLQNRVDEQVKKLGAASSELQSLAATKRKDADLSAREHELKVSYAALKAREASCASREKALALKKDVGARTEASAALPSASMTPTLATTPASTSKPPISRFADIARRYVFTPGLNPRANDTPTKTTPLSAKSKQLFAAVVDKAQSAVKASASKAERAKTATAVGMFNALQSVVGFKDGTASTSEPKKIAAPALTPSKKTLETHFPSSPTKPTPANEKPAEEKASEKKFSLEESERPSTRRSRRAAPTATETEDAPKPKKAPAKKKAKAAEPATEPATEPTTRKRGRTAKKPSTSEPEREADADDEPEVKRGRGRPRKTVAEDDVNAPKPASRPRGRPKKSEAASTAKADPLKHLQDFLSSGPKEAAPTTRRSTRSRRA